MKPSTDPTSIGKNRTGAGTSPRDADKTAAGARESTPNASFDVGPITAARLAYSQDAEPVGTLPPPATGKGVVSTVKEALKGEKATVLLDLLGERLGFERTGTRLYEAALAKVGAASDGAGRPHEEDLEEIRDDELAHVALLTDAMIKVGGDPTALTPCSDIMSVASEGLVKVLTDARTTLTEALKALLIAELADNDGWASLIDLAEKMGQDELVEQFRAAQVAEERHLELVRGWVTASIEGQAGVADEGPHTSAPPPAPVGGE